MKHRDSLTYTLKGTDSGKFTIDANARQVKSRVREKYDYKANASYTVMLKANDGRGLIAILPVTVNITNQSEPPLAPAAPSVSATSGSNTSLDISWTAPSNTGRPGINNYDIWYRQGTSRAWVNGPQDQTGISASSAAYSQARATTCR